MRPERLDGGRHTVQQKASFKRTLVNQLFPHCPAVSKIPPSSTNSARDFYNLVGQSTFLTAE
jgi:hypothetical protein